jgi:tetratricopeptide (TPR) repeat protein
VNFVDTQLQLQPIADHVLAFALGHEWTHLLQRDFERSQEIQGLISILATGREVEWVHFQSSLARSTEVYSDRYGLLLAYRARYKPTAAIAWCEAMEASVGDRQMNRDHPTLSERRMLLERYLEGDLQRAYDQFDVGLATFRRRDMGAATTAFEAYLDFLPNDGAALENLSILYFLRGVELLNGTPWAPFRLTHDLQTEPDLPPPQTRGDIPPEAVAWWERARFGANLLQRLHPDRPGAYQVLGDVALAFGELEQAQTIYAAGLELAPTHTGLLNNLGVCYALKKETLSARRLFEGVKARPVGEWNLRALGN